MDQYITPEHEALLKTTLEAQFKQHIILYETLTGKQVHHLWFLRKNTTLDTVSIDIEE